MRCSSHLSTCCIRLKLYCFVDAREVCRLKHDEMWTVDPATAQLPRSSALLLRWVVIVSHGNGNVFPPVASSPSSSLSDLLMRMMGGRVPGSRAPTFTLKVSDVQPAGTRHTLLELRLQLQHCCCTSVPPISSVRSNIQASRHLTFIAKFCRY